MKKYTPVICIALISITAATAGCILGSIDTVIVSTILGSLFGLISGAISNQLEEGN